MAMRSLTVPPARSARAARLRYVSDRDAGLARVRAGRGFTYRTARRRAVRDPRVLTRIRALAIPPAWTSVWICPRPTGHLQAVGRDARGRKQYRYHARWRECRDENKYARLVAFGRALGRIRRRVARDLTGFELSRERVVATVVRLLETSLIRVGNEEYARQNRSYGLTTLRSRHVQIRGPRLRFEFAGGKRHVVDVHDRRVAAIVRSCQDLPGHELFQYVDDDGRRRSVDSADVNAYLRQAGGDDFTAKDFRTWSGTLLALRTLAGSVERPPTKKRLLEAVRTVAERLGNTPAICRKCYIHPHVMDTYLAGGLARLDGRAGGASHLRDGLHVEERALLRFLGKPLLHQRSA
ncbi:MAG TPA: DNA topoisomerase IB [Methylomirabilota bacterium]|nr:DNA topoisomerase IB [Methylomirabilota bacterium]